MYSGWKGSKAFGFSESRIHKIIPYSLDYASTRLYMYVCICKYVRMIHTAPGNLVTIFSLNFQSMYVLSTALGTSARHTRSLVASLWNKNTALMKIYPHRPTASPI